MVQALLQVIDQGGARALLGTRLAFLSHLLGALACFCHVLSRLMHPAAKPPNSWATATECLQRGTHPLLKPAQVLKVKNAHSARLSSRKGHSNL